MEGKLSLSNALLIMLLLVFFLFVVVFVIQQTNGYNYKIVAITSTPSLTPMPTGGGGVTGDIIQMYWTNDAGQPVLYRIFDPYTGLWCYTAPQGGVWCK